MKLICSKCTAEKDESLFYKNKRYASGYMTWCKECHYAYYHKNPENRKKLQEAIKKWSAKNEEHLKQYAKEYHQENIEHAHERNNRTSRNRWATDPEYRKKKNFQKIPHNIRRRKIESKGNLTIETWNEICNSFGSICLCCGAPDITVDHIVPVSRGGTHTADNVQPLCFSCNSSKNILAIDYRWRWKTTSTYKSLYAVGE